MKDYLILHRQILQWEWHDDPYMLSLFVHLLCMANYLPDNKYRGKVQRIGELHTSVPKLAMLTGISQNTIITKLRKLQSTGEITFTSGVNGTDIFICKYAQYQHNAEGAGALAGALLAEPLAEQAAELNGAQLEVLAGAQVGVQVGALHGAQDGVLTDEPVQNGQKRQNIVQKHHSSPACSASSTPSCSATIAPQLADNQLNNNINIYNIKEKNKEKKKSDCTENTVQASSTAPASISQLEAEFELFRKAYKGTKRGLKAELDNLKAKNTNWREIVPLLMPALEREKAWREQMAQAGQFVPQWAYLQTWINQRRWEMEFEAVKKASATGKQAAKAQEYQQTPPSADEYGGSFGGMD